MIKVESFLPGYPEIHPISEERPSFEQAIAAKKEFIDLKSTAGETLVPSSPGIVMDHQKLLTRFLQSHTPYHNLLVFWEMGTGKTCASVAVVEALKNSPLLYRGAIVFARGQGLLKNYTHELVFKCSPRDRYVPPKYDHLSAFSQTLQVNRRVGKFYHFYTYETFAKSITPLSDAYLIEHYNYHVIVLDEVQNVRLKEHKAENDLNIYRQFHRFLHLLPQTKVLLLSGTPSKDQPDEIASVMNLILPMDMQLPTGGDFMARFFTPDGKTLQNTEELVRHLRGRISYVKRPYGPGVPQKIFMGSVTPPLAHFKVVSLPMNPHQARIYAQSVQLDSQERGVHSHSRQANLLVFHDDTYGAAGFQRHVSAKQVAVGGKGGGGHAKKFAFRDEFTRALAAGKGGGDFIERVSKFSIKYAYVLDLLRQHPREKMLIYSEFVQGSGLIALSLVLEQFGFTAAKGTESRPGLRYALVTHQTTSSPNQINALVRRFNAPDNVHGDYIAVLLGSRVIAEGYTLKEILHEIILTPHWNYSETSQVIARGWRLGAHDRLPHRESGWSIKIHHLVATMPPPSEVKSIDMETYLIAENKDLAIKQIELLIKKTAFDCPFHLERNKRPGHLYDNTRECEYSSCDYRCTATPVSSFDREDRSTFNVHYSVENDEESLTVLKNHFRNRPSAFLTWPELTRLFPRRDTFELAKAMTHLIYQDVAITDRYGFPRYLREYQDVLYLTDDPLKTPHYFSSYYSQRPQLSNGETFAEITEQLYQADLPRQIRQLFDRPDLTKAVISSLPSPVKVFLLQSAIWARESHASRHVEVRNIILDFFKGFYRRSPSTGKWHVFFMADELGSTAMEPDGTWTPVKEEEEGTAERRTAAAVPAPHSPIGVYGLYNPQTEAFCLKENETSEEKDARRKHVGKRCEDWSRPQLVDFVARRMKLPVPKKYRPDAEREAWIRDIKIAKCWSEDTDANASDEYLKRVAYWSQTLRRVSCEAIREWLEEKGLVVEDLDCGTQQKKGRKML